MVGIVAHQRGQIEGDGKPAAAVFQQIFITLVGFLRRGEARELPHGEKLAAISGGVNAARVGRLAGIAKIFFFAPVLRQIGFGIEASNRHAGNRSEACTALLVKIHARERANGTLGIFLDRGSERLLRPVLFCVSRLSIFKDVGDRTLGHLRLRLLWHANPSALIR